MVRAPHILVELESAGAQKGKIKEMAQNTIEFIGVQGPPSYVYRRWIKLLIIKVNGNKRGDIFKQGPDDYIISIDHPERKETPTRTEGYKNLEDAKAAAKQMLSTT